MIKLEILYLIVLKISNELRVNADQIPTEMKHFTR